MTHEIKARNVNDALTEAFWHLRTCGVVEQSRNGPVLVSPGPVVTTYTNPVERVLYATERDANPTFHLMEALWMLAGENDVEWLLQFNSQFNNYAEPDGKMHGAYGHRWRSHFGGDQIINVIDKLQADPHTRQAVIAMWSPEDDLVGDWRDRPCNTHIYFDTRNNMLNMTVCCRSNDAVWGAYGSNVVHFSMLQELIASAVGVDVGLYRQFSNNFHVYTDLPMVQKFLAMPPATDVNPYQMECVRNFPMLADGETYDHFLVDCKTLISGGSGFYTRFVHEVAHPMMQAYLCRKWGEPYAKHLSSMAQCDWYYGLVQWIKRRDAV